jgi:PTS system nitrogen regulatory IIA component
MQLTVQEAGKFLDVSESTITRWIKQRGLPAQHVGGQYRFHRAELLEWAAANKIKVSVELFQDLETDDEPVPSLADALNAGGIFHDVPGATKEESLRAMTAVLPLPDGIDREYLLRLFLAREAATTTAIGEGIALPHVRNPIVLSVERPSVTLCFLEQPVNFGALDGKPVQAFFSLICPTMRSHLQTLSRLSFALHDAKFKDAILRRAPGAEILAEARRVETALPAPPVEAGKALD